MQRDEYGRFLPRQEQRRGIGTASISGAESRPWQQSYGGQDPCRDTARKGGIATAIGVAAGAGIGAALMFLMDPEQGRRRRERIAHAAEHALEGTGQAARHAWEAGSEKAIEGAAAVYSATPSGGDVSRAGHRLMDRVSSAFGSTRDTAHDWLDSAKSHLPAMPHRRARRHGHEVSANTAGVGAAGALLLGLGAMWLFDPARGRARRAWIGQKSTRMLNETGSFMRATGRHVANKSKGYYHQSRSAMGGAGRSLSDSSIAESIRSSLGRLGLRSSSSVAVQCAGGCVTLTGRCVADDVDTIIATTRDAYGVDHVVNNMEVGDRFDAPRTSAPTSL